MSDYDTDILLWSEHQAELLRRRATGELVNEAEMDWPNIQRARAATAYSDTRFATNFSGSILRSSPVASLTKSLRISQLLRMARQRSVGSLRASAFPLTGCGRSCQPFPSTRWDAVVGKHQPSPFLPPSPCRLDGSFRRSTALACS
jgi:hypothetical protein